MCDELEKYMKNTVKKIREIIGDDLTGVYLTGSAAFDDLTDKSDLDLIAVSAVPLRIEQKKVLAGALNNEILPCPMAGLELITVRKSSALRLEAVPEFDLAMRTGEKWRSDIVFGGRLSELLIEFEIAAGMGKHLRGNRLVKCLIRFPASGSWV